MRGLQLSDMLGSGFSCNGNNVAYLAGSPAPLGAYGFNKKDISKVPYQDRPGPSISSSYISSLGFTIQSAVLPTAYPYMIFKGITTYGWPTGYWFFHGIIDKLKHILGSRNSQAMVFNVMGHDSSDGKITFKEGKLHFTPPPDPQLPRKVQALQKLTKKLGGILFMSRYRSTSVHLLGGCNAGPDPSTGVCNGNGQVFDSRTPGAVHKGLYVCDASLIPCSIGVNPSLTIAAAAEHVGKRLVHDALRYTSEENCAGQSASGSDKDLRSVVMFKETMRGHLSGLPCTAYLKMKMDHKHLFLRGKVGGYVECEAIEKDRLYVIEGEVNLCGVDSRTPYSQYMQYRLLLAASSGSRYVLEGRKVMNPYFFALHAWRETTTLHVTFKKVAKHMNSKEEIVPMKGQLRVSLTELLKTLMSFQGNGRGRFLCLFSQTLLRTYILRTPKGSLKDLTPSNSCAQPYPDSELHELKTGDGFVISCRQWKCIQDPARVMQEKLYPVLLLNGHSAESYWLPTEPNDLVRTLLDKGHETWLLQPRLHPLNPSNNFTLEDIGRFDIPAVMSKILEVHGASTKVHVVAHCVGGLAIHIALMGGHVSASHVASLSCTNSSMFFKLTTYSSLKMWLPLLPISMAILGKNTILPLIPTSKLSPRHRIIKSIALSIPRYERCNCEECEVFSGIFGNAFWHENITPTMHNWINKQNTTKLPMAAFPHIRKICNSGFIVDSDGNNSFLIHPERMTVPTLYVSGGRSLLVTPETSFLANRYMKLHQPGLRHERVVVDGFGHSDLLIGEESCKKVFPHILNHMRLAEEEGNGGVVSVGYNKEALDWEADLYEEAYCRGSWSWVLSLVGMVLFLFVVFFSFF